MTTDKKALSHDQLINELMQAAAKLGPGSVQATELQKEALRRLGLLAPENGVLQNHAPLRESQWNEIEDLED